MMFQARLLPRTFVAESGTRTTLYIYLQDVMCVLPH